MLMKDIRRTSILISIVPALTYLWLITYLGLYPLVVIAPFISLIIYPYVKIFIFRNRIRKIDKELLEFLSLLINFEAIGLHVNDLFRMIASGEIEVSKTLSYVAQKYVSLEKLYSDHIRALSKLATVFKSTRFSRFLEGYIGILQTTGDTLNYTETMLNEELSRLETNINGVVGFIENFYEAYLIVLLTVIVLSGLPGTIKARAPVYCVLLTINSVVFILSWHIVYRLYRYEPSIVTILSYLNVLLSSLLPLFAPIYTVLPLLLMVAITSTIISRALINWIKSVESSLYELTEDLYSETKHGFTIDRALERLSDRSISYRDIAYEITRLIKIGLKGDRIASIVNTSPLVARILKMILSPIEYSYDHSRHVGFTVKFLRRLYSIRDHLIIRARILLLYALILPITAYVMAYGLLSMASSPFITIDPGGLNGYVIASSIPAWLIACKVIDGYSLYSWRNIIMIVENVILYILFNL